MRFYWWYYEIAMSSVLANFIVVIHVTWIVFLVFGAYWGIRYRSVMALHGASLVFAVFHQVVGWSCPLTRLEILLRQYDRFISAYQGSFIAHYTRMLVPVDIRPPLMFALTLVLVAVNLFVYWKAFRKKSPG